MAVQAEPGLRISDVLLAAEGHFLRAAGGRYPGQAALHQRDEEVCDRKNRQEGAVVCSGLLPAGIYW